MKFRLFQFGQTIFQFFPTKLPVIRYVYVLNNYGSQSMNYLMEHPKRNIN